MLGALRHRNYRLFLTGQIISTIGTWMQSVAMPWLALQLTHNPFLVGLVLAAQFTPVLLGSQLGGVVADRYRKRSVLLVTQILFTVPSFALSMRLRTIGMSANTGASSVILALSQMKPFCIIKRQ